MSAGNRMSVATSAPRSHRGADSAGGPSMYRAIANAISALYDRMLRRADSRSASSYEPGMRTFVLIEVPNCVFLGIDFPSPGRGLNCPRPRFYDVPRIRQDGN